MDEARTQHNRPHATDAMTERHVGFTGTRNGMTEAQKAEVANILPGFQWLHHGGCIGADADAHFIAYDLNIKSAIHWPINGRRCALIRGNLEYHPLRYMARNRQIIQETELLIVAPQGMTEIHRSGTWATWRHAASNGYDWTIIFPDGTIEQKWKGLNDD